MRDKASGQTLERMERSAERMEAGWIIDDPWIVVDPGAEKTPHLGARNYENFS